MKKKSIIFFLILVVGIIVGFCLRELLHANETKIAQNAETTENFIAEDFETSAEADASEPEEILYTIEEVTTFPFETCPTQLELVNLSPCVLVDGMVYLQEGDTWKLLYGDTKVKEVYGGEYFCALTEDGALLLGEDVPKSDEITNMSASIFYNAEEIQKNTQNQKILDVNRNIVNESAIVFLENGTVEAFRVGTSCQIMDAIDVKAIEGNYVLTEDGDVYLILCEDGLETAEWKQISKEKIMDIFAAPKANRCLGLKEDGTLVEWKDGSSILEIQTGNVSDAAMGDYYSIVLDKEGRCYFYADDNEKLEEQINIYLEQIGKKAIHVTCAYERIAIMFEDYSITMIDFGQ